MANKKIGSKKKKGNKALKEPKVKLFPPGRMAELVFYSIIMFILGVLVGRGTAPIEFDLDHEMELKKLAVAEKNLKPTKVKIDFHKELSKDGEIKIDEKLIQKKEKLPVKSPKILAEKKQVELFDKLDEELEAEGNGEGLELKKEDNTFFTVQVAALKEANDADELSKRLIREGFEAYSVSGKSNDSSLWYKVRIGRFAKRENADNIKKSLLIKLNINGLVLRINKQEF